MIYSVTYNTAFTEVFFMLKCHTFLWNSKVRQFHLPHKKSMAFPAPILMKLTVAQRIM
jgi:hypothetical protein